MQHPAEIPIEQLLSQCTVKRTRGSGPGGQHRNKVETAIVIKHLPTNVIGQASEKRSQERNRETAVGRLRVNLAGRPRNVPHLRIA
jgi:protein subunit release factor B